MSLHHGPFPMGPSSQRPFSPQHPRRIQTLHESSWAHSDPCPVHPNGYNIVYCIVQGVGLQGLALSLSLTHPLSLANPLSLSLAAKVAALQQDLEQQQEETRREREEGLAHQKDLARLQMEKVSPDTFRVTRTSGCPWEPEGHSW